VQKTGVYEGLEGAGDRKQRVVDNGSDNDGREGGKRSGHKNGIVGFQGNLCAAFVAVLPCHSDPLYRAREGGRGCLVLDPRKYA
jgi:hypothetical protein